jgi:hypothetical protein
MQHLVNHGGKGLRCSAPCPLCFAPLVARELRLVRVRQVGAARVGGSLQFQLLKRSRQRIVPEPVAARAPPPGFSSSSSSASASLVPPARSGSAPGPSDLPQATAAASAAAGAEAAAAAVSPALAAGGGATASAGAGASSATAPATTANSDGLLSNLFAKWAVIGDASSLWREAAQVRLNGRKIYWPPLAQREMEEIECEQEEEGTRKEGFRTCLFAPDFPFFQSF